MTRRSKGCPPNECAYPRAHALLRDIEDGTLYLKTKNPLDPEDIAHFFGDLSLQSHVLALMEYTDGLIEGLSQNDHYSNPAETAVGGVVLTQLTDGAWRIA